MQRLLASPLGRAPGVRPILGFWQELAPLLADASFDSVLFDAFPNDDEQLSVEVIHQRGFMEHAYRLLRRGGVFTYMSGSASESAVEGDRHAARAAGFAESDIHIEPRNYTMVDHCETYPSCEAFPMPLLVTRLVKH